jgi:hypothetical protein
VSTVLYKENAFWLYHSHNCDFAIRSSHRHSTAPATVRDQHTISLFDIIYVLAY